MADPTILYSANTWLSYCIAQRYYNEIHYVWCTPYCDGRTLALREACLPPTSSPFEIYKNLQEEVRRGDRHSTKIVENKTGILRGAELKKEAGVITVQQERDIISIVERAEQIDFRPLLYVIPYVGVADIVREVPVEDKAHPLSQEYRIESLSRRLFDVIDIPI